MKSESKFIACLRDSVSILVLVYIFAGVGWLVFRSDKISIAFVNHGFAAVFSVFGLAGLLVLGAICGMFAGKGRTLLGALALPAVVVSGLCILWVLLQFAGILTWFFAWPFSFVGFAILAIIVPISNVAVTRPSEQDNNSDNSEASKTIVL